MTDYRDNTVRAAEIITGYQLLNLVNYADTHGHTLIETTRSGSEHDTYALIIKPEGTRYDYIVVPNIK